MEPNKERFRSLADLTVPQLRKKWGKADDTPGGQVYIPGLGGVTQGELSGEITRRSQPPKKVRPFRPHFHPIDGSWFMREANRSGARSRR